ncbi:GroES-like protein [Xylaria palmicola]|nr:GroES-like protein [Xylaria palmicola]
MAPSNKAAFYPSDKSPSLQIDASPYPIPSENELIIRVGATAVNPIDHKLQDLGTAIFPDLAYPYIGGFDVAGTVAETGPGVTGFKPGDRVLGFATDLAARAGGFQHYVAVPAGMAAPIPAGTSFAEAAVLPTGVATAAVALHRFLGLEPPALPPRPRKEGRAVLIAGGASSVGSNAIQLAVASGYEVITTSSRRNFAHCRALGASLVLDYRAADLAQQLKDAFRGKNCIGGVSCLEATNGLVFAVVGASQGSKRVACTILFSREGVPSDIEAEMIHAYWVRDTPLAEAIFGAFLPEALARGEYKCEPRPLVVGRGLESLQPAFDIGKEGSVSCEKLVVVLEAES